MGVRYTLDQQKVIDTRGNNILVSAAAGSGKTAVLTERIINRIINERISVDELLVMTFTKAAAAEMKDRIKAKLEKCLLEDPGSMFLSEQIGLICMAEISTVHSFCLNVIRDNVELTMLDPDFRPASESETMILQKEVLDEVLEDYYAGEDKDFLHLIEACRSGHTDKNIEDRILSVCEYARSFPSEEVWFDSVRSMYSITSVSEIAASPWYRELVDYAKAVIQNAVYYNEYLLDLAPDLDCGKLTELLENDRAVISSLRDTVDKYINLLGSSPEEAMDGIRDALMNVSFNRFITTSSKAYDEIRQDLLYVKSVRGEYSLSKGMIKNTANIFFTRDAKEELDIIRQSARDVMVLVDVSEEFLKRFSKRKLKKNIIDFSDMEHFALDILAVRDESGQYVPTQTGLSYRDRFKEILIDEYQDTSFIQEEILRAIAREKDGERNLFMVGDVKQSIYGFRNARPEIFVGKYNKYSFATDEPSLPGINISLRKNFRSRAEVLDSANDVFYGCMMSEVGGIDYDKDSELDTGADYPSADGQSNKTEVKLIFPKTDELDDTDDTVKEMEARTIAKSINALMKDFKVTENGSLRPLKYSDIAILLNTRVDWSERFEQIFTSYGIPFKSEKTRGYYDTSEVMTIINYLKMLDNPLQDIALTSVLTSPIGGFTGEELARIRISNKSVRFYDAFNEYPHSGEDPLLAKKIDDIRDMFERHRKMLIDYPLHRVIYSIIRDSGYDYFVRALPNGEQKKTNLDILISEAYEFEKTADMGLFYFLKYIERMKKFGIDRGEADIKRDNDDAVTLVTIHKSKGLEYPVVYVPELGKPPKNPEKAIRFDSKYTVAIPAYNEDEKCTRTTLLSKAIALRNKKDDAAERLRVLYVAMTRAREKLILVGNNRTSKPEEIINKWRGQLFFGRRLSPDYVANMSNFMDIIMPIAYAHPEHFDVETVDLNDIRLADIKENVRTSVVSKWFRELKYLDASGYVPTPQTQRLDAFTGFAYPYGRLSIMRPKVTVSYAKSLNGMVDEPEISETEKTFIRDEFEVSEEEVRSRAQSARRGTTYHAIMEHLDYRRADTTEQIDTQIKEMAKSGLIDETDIPLVSSLDILNFALGDIGQRIRKASDDNRLKREQPFMMEIDASDVYDNALKGDKILMQGVIDLYMIEDDGIVLIDYKTDKTQSEKVLKDRYSVQLKYYKDALERALEISVKECYIYSFKLNRLIPIA